MGKNLVQKSQQAKRLKETTLAAGLVTFLPDKPNEICDKFKIVLGEK